jgi:dTDP-4-dehydrorhamnose reductase
MRIFLAGATGAIGRPLTSQLLAADHEVVAMTRSRRSAIGLRKLGATPMICDVFDREGLRNRICEARPDVVIHRLTALPKRIDPRTIQNQIAATLVRSMQRMALSPRTSSVGGCRSSEKVRACSRSSTSKMQPEQLFPR